MILIYYRNYSWLHFLYTGDVHRRLLTAFVVLLFGRGNRLRIGIEFPSIIFLQSLAETLYRGMLENTESVVVVAFVRIVIVAVGHFTVIVVIVPRAAADRTSFYHPILIRYTYNIFEIPFSEVELYCQTLNAQTNY